jgi:hypothetical protein
MEMKMRSKWIAGAAVIGLLGTATPVAISVAGVDSSQELTASQKIDAVKRAYPALADTAPGAPAPMGKAAVAAATLKQADGEAVAITATDHGEFCLETGGTSTCADADQASQDGLYIVEVDCSVPTARVTGVMPKGTSRVTAVGTDSSAVPSDSGVVVLGVPGASFNGLALSNGKTHPLALHNVCAARPADQTK